MIGGLPLGAVIGIAVAAGVLLLCIIANFIPLIAARHRGEDPRKVQTLVGAAVRITKSYVTGQNGNGVKMYR